MLAGLLPYRWARREGPTVIAIVGLLAAAVMSILLWGNRIVALGGGYRIDRLGVLFNLIFIGCAIATLLLSVQESAGVDRRGEYAALVVTATAGMVLVAGAGDLITIFLGIEILSVALYVLCALELWRERSLESGLKYLIVGAVGSSFLLYGLAFLFGTTGSVNLSAIGRSLTQALVQHRAAAVGRGHAHHRRTRVQVVLGARSTCGRPTSTRARRRRSPHSWRPPPRRPPSSRSCASSRRR